MTMTRGAERKIFHVKDPQSPYFEEVWLVLRRGAGKRRGAPPAAATLAEEADTWNYIKKTSDNKCIYEN